MPDRTRSIPSTDRLNGSCLTWIVDQGREEDRVFVREQRRAQPTRSWHTHEESLSVGLHRGLGGPWPRPSPESTASGRLTVVRTSCRGVEYGRDEDRPQGLATLLQPLGYEQTEDWLIAESFGTFTCD